MAASGNAAAAVAFAQKQLGEPYVWAAAGPNTWDCSGLTMKAWQAAGISPARSGGHFTGSQYARLVVGRPTRTVAQAQPGDMVFFGVPPVPHHVGLYIGNGKMIEAPQAGDVVKVSPVNQYRDLINKVGAFPGSSTSSIGGAAGGGTNVQTMSVSQMVYNMLRGLGLNNDQAAGGLGNLEVESGFNPAAYNANENAHNIGQFEGVRWSGPTGLQAFAKKQGLDPNSAEAGVGYLQYELTHGYKGVLGKLKKAKTVDEAATIWQSQYEVSTPASLPDRIKAARKFASQLAAGKPLTAGPTATNTGASNFTGGRAGKPEPPVPLPLPNIISADQRAAMISWLNTIGHTVAADISDTDLRIAYTSEVGKFDVGADTGGDIVGLVFQGIRTLAGPIVGFLGNALVVVLGVVMVVIALALVASSTGNDVSVNTVGRRKGGRSDSDAATAADLAGDAADAAE